MSEQVDTQASKDSPQKDNSEIQKPFVCSQEASALLNCVTDPHYNEHKCLPLLKKLRDCVKKKGVVRFDLVSESDHLPNGVRAAIIAGGGVGLCLVAGRYVMHATNPEMQHDKSYENEHLLQIKAHQSDRSKFTTERNRRALEQMLDELKNHSDEERYQAALRGKILDSKNRQPYKD